MTAKTILIIEDERPLSNALSLKFKKEGFSVLVAGNGKEGLDICTSKKIDFVLLDLMLPEMDGFTVLENLMKAKFTSPVVILSNLSQEEDIAKVKALGAREYFVKSDTPIRDIITYVKELLNEPPQ